MYAFPAPSEPFNPRLRSVLLHDQVILHARWNPVQAGSMLLCCGTRAVYTWNSAWDDGENNLTEIAECVGIPAGWCCLCLQTLYNIIFTDKFEVRNAKWSPDGKGFVLLDHSAFCCAFEAIEETHHATPP